MNAYFTAMKSYLRIYAVNAYQLRKMRTSWQLCISLSFFLTSSHPPLDLSIFLSISSSFSLFLPPTLLLSLSLPPSLCFSLFISPSLPPTLPLTQHSNTFSSMEIMSWPSSVWMMCRLMELCLRMARMRAM